MNEQLIIRIWPKLYLIKLTISTAVLIWSIPQFSRVVLFSVFRTYRWLWFVNTDPLIKMFLPMISIFTTLISMFIIEWSWAEMTLLDKVTCVECLMSFVCLIGLAMYGLILRVTYNPLAVPPAMNQNRIAMNRNRRSQAAMAG